jgi:hypothetical protein
MSMDYLGTIIILAIGIVLASLAGAFVLGWLGDDGKGMAALVAAVTFVFVVRVLQETGDWWQRT